MTKQPASSLPDEAKRLLLWRVIRPLRRYALGVAALVLIDTALTSLGVGLILPVFQSVLNPDHNNAFLSQLLPFLSDFTAQERLLILAGGTAAVFIAKGAISFATVFFSHTLFQQLRFYWVKRIGEQYLYGSYLKLAGSKQGELLNDWFNETLSASRFFQSYLIYLSSAALALSLLVLCLVVNVTATLALLAIGALAALLARRLLYGPSEKLSEVKLSVNQSVSSSMLENIGNLRDIKLMLAENLRLEQLDALCQRLKAIFVRSAVKGELPRILGEPASVSIIMALLVVGLVIGGNQPQQILPMLAFFFVAIYRLISAVGQVVSSRVKALNDIHSLYLIDRLINDKTEKEDRATGSPIGSLETDIRFEQLSFSYDGERSALEQVDAVVPRGKVTFLLGPSGGGKSTLLDLLLRLVEPTAGYIGVNGRRASEYNLAQWRRCFGYVSQEASLFNGSIRMNLRLARPQATDGEIEAACRLAGADEFVRFLPDGYETPVGDRGHSLSGGQRKRIAIARALINRPSVLILDEATTSFEQSLEQSMLRAIKAAMPELTVIQVTHRIQTATDADWVIALDAGRVIASGPWIEAQRHFAPQFPATFRTTP